MRALVMIIAAAALLAGCSTRFDISGRDWTKAGAGLPEVSLDEMDCARVAVDARPFPDTIVGGVADIAMATMQDAKMHRDFSRCMAGKGYQRS